MPRFAPALALLLLAGTVAADDPPKKAPTAADDLQRLQGTWTVAAWEEGGKALAAADLKTRGVFVGANALVLKRDGKPYQVSSVQLDPAKSPPLATLTVQIGEGKGDVLLGIYSLDGDTLKLCFDPKSQARPKDFKPDAKDGFTLITLKKPKPPADETVNIVGKYRSELLDPVTGKTDVAEVTVERRGDGYSLTYRLNDRVSYVGTALRKGDQLSMGWVSGGQIGVSVYKIEAGPKLVGEYTVLGGIGEAVKETLTPWKKVD